MKSNQTRVAQVSRLIRIVAETHCIQAWFVAKLIDVWGTEGGEGGGILIQLLKLQRQPRRENKASRIERFRALLERPCLRERVKRVCGKEKKGKGKEFCQATKSRTRPQVQLNSPQKIVVSGVREPAEERKRQK